MADSKTVLMVDDDQVLNEMYSERLKGEGFEVVSATNGEEALKKASDVTPAVILLDVMMPKMNGLEVLKRLRANDKTREIPVIVLTALIQQLDEIKNSLQAKDSYLIKSETLPAQVVEKVKEAIG